MSYLFSYLKNVILLAFSLLAFFNIAAFAGTPAQTIDSVDLRDGPGLKYDTTYTIEAQSDIIVERCQKRWCLVSNKSAKGWVSVEDISFGVNATGAYSGVKRDQALQGSGEICFYTGDNFSGEAICSKTGIVMKDLALYGRDNSFASISIEGEISAMVCRDRDFSSYCETITKDQPTLGKLLKYSISSYRVW